MQQPFSSKLIRFPYPEPEHSDLYKEIFHCPVEFNADYLEWQFDATTLYDPLPAANTMTLQMCLKSCDELLATVQGSTSLNEKITQLFVERLGNYPSIEALSSELGMSSRTLRRYLKSEGTSYQQLLDDVRYRLARHYLLNTQITIEEISDRVAFLIAPTFDTHSKNGAVTHLKNLGTLKM